MNKNWKSMRIKQAGLDSAFIAAFFGCLCLPMVLTQPRDTSRVEQRRLAPFPHVSINLATMKRFPGEFQRWYADHFGLRDHLAQAYYWLCFKLRSSPSPQVIIGRQRWLFYNSASDGNSLADYRGNDPLTADELERWELDLEAKHQWLKKRGIPYVFVVAPNKQSIYGECFPSRYRKIGAHSRLDQFIEHMRGSAVPVLDLRQALIDAKPDGKLYYKNDTHWNNYGAAVAQHAIVRHVASVLTNVCPVSCAPEDFRWSGRRRGGDIANMLNLSSILEEENDPDLLKAVAGFEREMIGDPVENPSLQPFMTRCDGVAPSALIFRDSFFSALVPYISTHFSPAVYFWIQPDIKKVDMPMLEKLVERHAPDLVIEERVERSLKIVPDLRLSVEP